MPEFPPPSYFKAVATHAWREFLPGLRSWPREIVAALFSLGISFYLYKRFGSTDAAPDTLVDKLLIVPVFAAGMALVHFVWSWATAARKIYHAQQTTIAELKESHANEIKTLTLERDEAIAQRNALTEPKLTIDCEPQNVGRNETMYVTVSSGNLFVEKVSVVVKSISGPSDLGPFPKYLQPQNVEGTTEADIRPHTTRNYELLTLKVAQQNVISLMFRKETGVSNGNSIPPQEFELVISASGSVKGGPAFSPDVRFRFSATGEGVNVTRVT